jgi:hypothetical protein
LTDTQKEYYMRRRHASKVLACFCDVLQSNFRETHTFIDDHGNVQAYYFSRKTLFYYKRKYKKHLTCNLDFINILMILNPLSLFLFNNAVFIDLITSGNILKHYIVATSTLVINLYTYIFLNDIYIKIKRKKE